MSRRERISELHREYERLQAAPQTFDKEFRRVFIKLELDELEAQRAHEIAKKTKMLIEAYRNSGSMRVMLPDGRICEGAPVVNVASDIQRLWNVRSEAATLADWGTP